MKHVAYRKLFLHYALKRSIHPQGWVPIETGYALTPALYLDVAFTPKGGCPLKPTARLAEMQILRSVAFTPKGGCPLKRDDLPVPAGPSIVSSIHPQGWVPIETFPDAFAVAGCGGNE